MPTFRPELTMNTVSLGVTPEEERDEEDEDEEGQFEPTAPAGTQDQQTEDQDAEQSGKAVTAADQELVAAKEETTQEEVSVSARTDEERPARLDAPPTTRVTPEDQESQAAELGAKSQRQFRRGDVLGGASTAAKSGIETVFDQPLPGTGQSLQEFGQSYLAVATGTGDPSQGLFQTEEAEEQAAERTQRSFIGLRRAAQEAPAEAGEGTPLQEGRTGEAADVIASGSGALFDVFVYEPFTAGVTTASGVDPSGGSQLGISELVLRPAVAGWLAISERDPGFITDPRKRQAIINAVGPLEAERGEVAGKTETVPEPVDLVFDVLPGLVAGRAAARYADEIAGATDEAAQAAKAVDEGTTAARGGEDVGEVMARGAETQGQASMSILDEIALGAARGVEDVTGLGRRTGRVTEDIPSGAQRESVESLATMDFEEFAGTQTSVNLGEEFAGITDIGVESADEALPALVDDLPTRGVSEGIGPRSATAEAVEEAVPSLDEIAGGFTRTVEDAAARGPEGEGAFDEAFEGTARAGDEVARGADEAAESGRLIDGRLAAATGGGLLGAAGVTLFGGPGDGGGDSGGSGGAGPGAGPQGESNVWSGDLRTQSPVAQGQGFPVEATVINTDQAPHEARIAVFVQRGDQTGRLGSRRVNLRGGGRTSLDFDTEQRTAQLPEGDYTVILAATSGEGQGRLASRSVTIQPRGEGQQRGGARGEWGEVSIVRELGQGWYLARQQHKTEDEQRFFVVGKRENGEQIYLRPGGQVQSSPHAFDTAEKAVAAFRAWLQRARNGNTSQRETPSATGGRPSGQQIREQARGGLPGGTGTIAVAVVLFVALWYVSDGHPIRWLNRQFEDLTGINI